MMAYMEISTSSSTTALDDHAIPLLPYPPSATNYAPLQEDRHGFQEPEVTVQEVTSATTSSITDPEAGTKKTITTRFRRLRTWRPKKLSLCAKCCICTWTFSLTFSIVLLILGAIRKEMYLKTLRKKHPRKRTDKKP